MHRYLLIVKTYKIYIYIYTYLYPTLIYNISSDKERFPNWKRRDCYFVMPGHQKRCSHNPVLPHGKNGSNPFGLPKMKLPTPLSLTLPKTLRLTAKAPEQKPLKIGPKEAGSTPISRDFCRRGCRSYVPSVADSLFETHQNPKDMLSVSVVSIIHG